MKVIVERSNRSIEASEVIVEASDRKILKHLDLDPSNHPKGLQHNRSPPDTMFEKATAFF